jgi:hypothetical protein
MCLQALLSDIIMCVCVGGGGGVVFCRQERLQKNQQFQFSCIISDSKLPVLYIPQLGNVSMAQENPSTGPSPNTLL